MNKRAFIWVGLVALAMMMWVAVVGCATAPSLPATPTVAAPTVAPTVAAPTVAPTVAAPTVAPAPTKPTSIVIGVITAQSPPGNPATGTLIIRGAELGVEYVNSELKGVLGGVPLQVAVEDEKGSPEPAVAGYRKLVSDKKVPIVIGCSQSSAGLAVNEVAKEIGVPNMVTACTNPDLTAKQYDIAFSTIAGDDTKVALLMKFAAEKKFSKVAILMENTDYGFGFTQQVRIQAAKSSPPIEILPVVFDRKVTDLTPQLLQIQAWKPDLFINGGVAAANDLILDQATTVGLYPSVPMAITYAAPGEPDFWQRHPKNAVGVYWIGFYSAESQLSSAGKWMSQRYKAKFNEEPGFFSFNAFGQILTIAQALNQAGSADPKALIKALEKGSFDNWSTTPATFPRTEGVGWHHWAAPALLQRVEKTGQSVIEMPVVSKYP